MKYSAVLLGFVFSFASLAQVPPSGVTLTGIPTASKVYSRTTLNESELPALAASIKSECLNDKAESEDFAKKNGFKIISSTGCDVRVSDPIFTDGTPIMGQASTDFKVLFK